MNSPASAPDFSIGRHAAAGFSRLCMSLMPRIEISRKRLMTFQESIKTCFSKYADFSGTASRSEYWWFFLLLAIIGVASSATHQILSILATVATISPSIAAATRRLHDTNRSGWWQLLALVPFVGAIALFFLLAQRGTAEKYSEQ